MPTLARIFLHSILKKPKRFSCRIIVLVIWLIFVVTLTFDVPRSNGMSARGEGDPDCPPGFTATLMRLADLGADAQSDGDSKTQFTLDRQSAGVGPVTVDLTACSPSNES